MLDCTDINRQIAQNHKKRYELICQCVCTVIEERLFRSYFSFFFKLFLILLPLRELIREARIGKWILARVQWSLIINVLLSRTNKRSWICLRSNKKYKIIVIANRFGYMQKKNVYNTTDWVYMNSCTRKHT